MHNFKGKVAIVTGASDGIGETIATELQRCGATVVITGRHLDKLLQTARRIDPTGQSIIALQTDVRNADSVKALIDEVASTHGVLHMLVNNAGITGPHGVTVTDYEIDDWNDVIATDLSGAFFATKYAIPLMLKNCGGSIVNLSAVNGFVGIAGITPYTVAKHGIIGLTQATALEYAQQGIRINAVAPGYVDTPQMKNLPDEVRAGMAATHPMGRMATREEIAKTVLFLLSEESSFTTGAIYRIDGGYLAQ